MKKRLLIIGVVGLYLLNLWMNQQEPQSVALTTVQKSEAKLLGSSFLGFTTTSAIAPSNSGTPTISFTTTSQTVSETSGSASVSVQIDCPNSGSSVTVARLSGTATNGSDYNFTSSTITFQGTVTTQQISVPLINDTEVEGNETLVLRLQSPTGGAVVSGGNHTITITSEDVAPPPQVRFIAASQTVDEDDGTIAVTLGITNPNAAATTIQVALDGGTATNGMDYNFTSPSTVTFPANSSANQTINIPITDDFLVESTETILLRLQNPSNSMTTPTLGTSNHTISIMDNDVAPTVSFVAGSQTIDEAAGTATIMLSITNPNNAMSTVEVTVSGGSATDGSDYTFSDPTTVTFPANSSMNQMVIINIIDDFMVESTETIVLSLQNPSNSAATPTLGTSTHTVSITDNDVAPTLSFVDGSQTIDEAAGTATVMLLITNPNNVMSTVEVTVSGGSATDGSDYTFSDPTTVTFPANSAMNQMVTINIIDDFMVESTETIVLSLQNPSNSAATPTLGTSTHTVSITDNDVAPTLSFVDGSQTIDEAAGTTTVMLSITNPNNAMSTVEVTVSGGSASDGSDYTFSDPTTVTFPANSAMNQMVTINIIDDEMVEGSETIELGLQNANNSVAMPSIDMDSHIMTIQDNDFPVELSLKVVLEGPYEEANGTMSTTLNTMGLLPNDQPYDVAPWNYTTTGDDATIASFPANTVDWILVQLVNGSNMQTEVTRAALLLSDGSVVDGSGNPLSFENLPSGQSYHIMIRHRNHIDIISATAQLLNEGTNSLIDLTQPANVLGGNEQVNIVNSGTVGTMKAGDFTANGIISVGDFNQLVMEITQSGYFSADCTLNGLVGTEDFNFYLPNASAIGVLLIRY